MSFGCIAGLLTSFGFIRWVFTIPEMAKFATSNENVESMSLILESNIKLIHSYSGVALGENLAFLLQGLWLVLLAIDLAVNHTKDKKLFIPPMIIGVGIIIYSLEQFGGIFSGPGVMNTPLQAAWPVWPMALGWASLNAEKRKKLHLTTKVAIGYSWGFVVLMFLV